MKGPDPHNAEEMKLIRLAQKGDERAFTRLVRTYEDVVFRFSLKVCRDAEKAEEAFQDTFVNVFKNQEDIRFLKKEATPLADGDEVSIVPAIAGG